MRTHFKKKFENWFQINNESIDKKNIQMFFTSHCKLKLWCHKEHTEVLNCTCKHDVKSGIFWWKLKLCHNEHVDVQFIHLHNEDASVNWNFPFIWSCSWSLLAWWMVLVRWVIQFEHTEQRLKVEREQRATTNSSSAAFRLPNTGVSQESETLNLISNALRQKARVRVYPVKSEPARLSTSCWSRDSLIENHFNKTQYK